MQWPDTEQNFRNAIFESTPPTGITARAPREAEIRFCVYRNNITHSLSRALASRFAVIERLVGGAFFAAMAREFLHAHPPRSPVLHAWGAAFPAFLDDFAPVAHLPYLSAVARLELARGRAYHAADAPPADARALAQAAQEPARLYLDLHPSVQSLCAPQAFVSIWRANQAGTPPGRVVADHPQAAVVLRDARDQVQVLEVALGDIDCLGALQAGRSLLEAASLTQDPAALFTRLITAGAITRFSLGEAP
ncbi:hypothetical protein AQS8620_01733 [Aquimixticola soesokkakensis]|uniref:Putative DNA-binding domain-containing protein n=1 Tax=Aquimixticola soesokkakensis TaxID=1519096 RepID=A0A1Y5SPF1_9RHOB|nr:DNA-binding domain-containing protein [Aquimixticola soesokkakensis]SLN43652.1 hypothetical protein AQS8620_01733 [Aquimixticola soesokkakensis]